MKTCATCLYWRHLGESQAPRHVHYDSRYVTVPAGPEGQCRARPPAGDSRWPMTCGGDWCGCWREKTLTEAPTPRASAAGETPEPTAPDSAQAPAEAGKGAPPVKPAAGSPAGGPPSLLQRITGRGHGRRNP